MQTKLYCSQSFKKRSWEILKRNFLFFKCKVSPTPPSFPTFRSKPPATQGKGWRRAPFYTGGQRLGFMADTHGHTPLSSCTASDSAVGNLGPWSVSHHIESALCPATAVIFKVTKHLNTISPNCHLSQLSESILVAITKYHRLAGYRQLVS